MPIPLIDVRAHQAIIGSEVNEAIARVVEHGKWIMGPEVAAFEADLAHFCGAAEVVSCSNGTDALLLALMALGVGPGDHVIVPTFTFFATAEIVSFLGAIPVFADSEADGFNVCPESVRSAADALAARGTPPAAIIGVGLFGHAPDLVGLRDVADDFGAHLVDDAAQSFGARTPAGPVGSLADVTTTSFFPAKPLGCYGDGGACFTESEEAAALMRSMRVHGKGTHKYDNLRIGMNARLDTIQAAILAEKLRIFPTEIDQRNKVASYYNTALGELATIPIVRDGHVSTWAQYTIETPQRDRVVAALKKAEIGHAVYYQRPLHEQPVFAGAEAAPTGLLRSEALSAKVVSIPMHPYLTDIDLQTVVEVVSGALA